MVVGARRSHGEELVTASHQQNVFFSVDLADEHRAIGKLGERNAGREIALRRFFHIVHPVMSRMAAMGATRRAPGSREARTGCGGYNPEGARFS